jgi:hypothetical protein
MAKPGQLKAIVGVFHASNVNLPVLTMLAFDSATQPRLHHARAQFSAPAIGHLL